MATSHSPQEGAAPTKIIVLTDLHMVPAGDTIIGIDPFERLRSAVEHINANHGDAARVVILGDLTHGGDRASYRRVRDLIGRLVPPVSLMVGNHDDRTNCRAVFGPAVCDEQGFAHSEIAVGGYQLVMLDTLQSPAIDGADGASGSLCPARLRWLDRRLKAAGRTPVILFMHHPPMATGFPGMDAVRLLQPDAMLQVIQWHGNVRHIVAGHIHRTISGAWHGIPFAIFKSPVHQQPLDFASGSSGLSVDEPGAYGLLLLTRTGVIAHTEDFDVARRALEQGRSDS